jgi:hypothetical protein
LEKRRGLGINVQYKGGFTRETIRTRLHGTLASPSETQVVPCAYYLPGHFGSEGQSLFAGNVSFPMIGNFPTTPCHQTMKHWDSITLRSKFVEDKHSHKCYA